MILMSEAPLYYAVKSKNGTHKTAKARFLPGLSFSSPWNLVNCHLFVRKRKRTFRVRGTRNLHGHTLIQKQDFPIFHRFGCRQAVISSRTLKHGTFCHKLGMRPTHGSLMQGPSGLARADGLDRPQTLNLLQTRKRIRGGHVGFDPQETLFYSKHIS